jgi:hypothetical protein
MYPVERYMKNLKGYVKNMARLEASMAEGYLKDECLGLVTEYLQKFYDSGAPRYSTPICVAQHICDATYVLVRKLPCPCLIM